MLIIISINPDDPGVFAQSSTAMDYLIAAIYWEWSLKEIRECIDTSIEHALFNDSDKSKIRDNFQKKWEIFEKDILDKL